MDQLLGSAVVVNRVRDYTSLFRSLYLTGMPARASVDKR